LAIWGDASAAMVVRFTGSSGFLKIRLDEPAKIAAVGMLDRQGHGPIVIVPPFHEPIEISFIAEAVVQKPDTRANTASALRVPVAVVLPDHHGVADLLTALGSPSLDHASSVWEDAVPSVVEGSGSADVAADMLLKKFDRPAEALLAAHFLLRFLPERLPLDWADNLMKAHPTAADGPVIAAWSRITGVSSIKQDKKRCDKEFKERIRVALSRPTVFFARTRYLLCDALRMLELETADPAPTDFLDHGAHAGGLEAFWGSNPLTPGSRAALPISCPRTIVARVRARSTGFAALHGLSRHS
jgi:hypothetical protein